MYIMRVHRSHTTQPRFKYMAFLQTRSGPRRCEKRNYIINECEGIIL